LGAKALKDLPPRVESLEQGIAKRFWSEDLSEQDAVYGIRRSPFNSLLIYSLLVHPKMKILSVFTHHHVVPNFYVFICSAVHKGRYLEECFNHTDLIPH